MTILVAILNAIKDLAKAILANRNELATLNAQSRLMLQKQEYLIELSEDTAHTVDMIWGALKLEDAARIEVPWTLDGSTETEGDNVNLTDSQKGTLGPIKVTDKKGAPATLDGTPVWATSDETIATVTPSEDGLSATVNGVLPGTCTYTVTGDSDLGEGVKPLIGKGTITVTPGEAVVIDVPESEPEDQ